MKRKFASLFLLTALMSSTTVVSYAAQEYDDKSVLISTMSISNTGGSGITGGSTSGTTDTSGITGTSGTTNSSGITGTSGTTNSSGITGTSGTTGTTTTGTTPATSVAGATDTAGTTGDTADTTGSYPTNNPGTGYSAGDAYNTGTGTGYNSQAGYNTGAGYNSQTGHNTGAGYNSQAGYNTGAGHNTIGGYNTNTIDTGHSGNAIGTTYTHDTNNSYPASQANQNMYHHNNANYDNYDNYSNSVNHPTDTGYHNTIKVHEALDQIGKHEPISSFGNMNHGSKDMGYFNESNPRDANGQIKVSKDTFIVQDGDDLWLVMGNIKAKLDVLIYTDPNNAKAHEAHERANTNSNASIMNDKNSLAIPVVERTKY